MTNLLLKRKFYNACALSMAVALGVISFFILLWILYTLCTKGLPGLNWQVITGVTKSPGRQGGLLNPLIGSLIMSFTAVLIGSPIGILAAVFLAQYHTKGRLSAVINFLIDILLGTPAIIIGLFIYQLVVKPTGHFSGWAGSLSLTVMVIPLVARTTESIYLLVPNSLHEAVTALGASSSVLIRFMIFRVIKAAVLTGVLLALARIIGEAAPLLFTALNNQFLSTNMNLPMANMPVTIFNYAMSPYIDWQQLAWTGALMTTFFVLVINLLARALIKK